MSTLQDVKPKKVEIKFRDGSVHEVQFTLNALALLEEKYGDVIMLINDLSSIIISLDKGSFVAIRYMLWAALQHEAEPLTETEVGNMIDINSLQDISGLLTEAVGNDMPTEEQILAVAGPVPAKAVEAPNH